METSLPVAANALEFAPNFSKIKSSLEPDTHPCHCQSDPVALLNTLLAPDKELSSQFIKNYNETTSREDSELIKKYIREAVYYGGIEPDPDGKIAVDLYKALHDSAILVGVHHPDFLAEAASNFNQILLKIRHDLTLFDHCASNLYEILDLMLDSITEHSFSIASPDTQILLYKIYGNIADLILRYFHRRNDQTGNYLLNLMNADLKNKTIYGLGRKFTVSRNQRAEIVAGLYARYSLNKAKSNESRSLPYILFFDGLLGMGTGAKAENYQQIRESFIQLKNTIAKAVSGLTDNWHLDAFIVEAFRDCLEQACANGEPEELLDLTLSMMLDFIQEALAKNSWHFSYFAIQSLTAIALNSPSEKLAREALRRLAEIKAPPKTSAPPPASEAAQIPSAVKANLKSIAVFEAVKPTKASSALSKVKKITTQLIPGKKQIAIKKIRWAIWEAKSMELLSIIEKTIYESIRIQAKGQLYQIFLELKKTQAEAKKNQEQTQIQSILEKIKIRLGKKIINFNSDLEWLSWISGIKSSSSRIYRHTSSYVLPRSDISPIAPRPQSMQLNPVTDLTIQQAKRARHQ